MGQIVNLNRFRKERARAEKRTQADVNAAKFGRTRAERELQEAQAEKSARAHDAHLIEPLEPKRSAPDASDQAGPDQAGSDRGGTDQP